MNKRIRKKIAKREAEHHEELSPNAALQQAVEELKDSAVHLLETALHELQQSTSLLVGELRVKALDWMAYFRQSVSGRQSQHVGRQREHRATA